MISFCPRADGHEVVTCLLCVCSWSLAAFIFLVLLLTWLSLWGYFWSRCGFILQDCIKLLIGFPKSHFCLYQLLLSLAEYTWGHTYLQYLTKNYKKVKTILQTKIMMICCSRNMSDYHLLHNFCRNPVSIFFLDEQKVQKNSIYFK